MQIFCRLAIVVTCSIGLPASLAHAGVETCPDTPPSLVHPAEGRRVVGFGEKIPSGKTAQGNLTETAAGAAVVAPAKGQVKSAGIDRSFGLVIVLDIGCNRELSITGAETSLVKAGDTVESRAAIATMSTEAGKAPVLYIELRENGRPVDPKL